MLKIAYLQSRIISILKLENTAKKPQKLNKTNKQAKTKTKPKKKNRYNVNNWSYGQA